MEELITEWRGGRAANPRGTNQSGLRAYNERLVLSMLHRQGAMAGSDVARLAGLSAQTVSVIMRRLEQDGLLLRGDPVRGKVGKPSVPMSVNPDGAFAIGLKIGRRTADLVLADLMGEPRIQLHAAYRYPMPEAIVDFLKGGIATIKRELTKEEFGRIAGIGIAKPYEIWSWHESIGAPEGEIARWKLLNFEDEIAQFTHLPVYVDNDATAACRAEHIYGRGRELGSFGYFYIGSFVGGGIVLNETVFDGALGNAGSFGSLPARRADGTACQLVDAASLYLLEADLARAGVDPGRLWVQPQDWSDFSDVLDDWIERTSAQLAQACLTVCAVVDFDTILLDGAFPEAVRERMVERTRSIMASLDHRGLIIPKLEGGTIGRNARALGAASAPMFSQFLLNTHAGFAQG